MQHDVREANIPFFRKVWDLFLHRILRKRNASTDNANEKKKEEQTLQLPAVHSEAHFGPTLSQIKAKLGTKPGKEGEASARTWLIHWVTNPTLHSPRTRGR